MKKVIISILSLCMCVTLGVALTACGSSEHTHVYEKNWSYDESFHWHKCEKEDCIKISDKLNHTLQSGVCLTCGYEQNIPAPPPASSTNEVSEVTFYKALSFEDVESMTVYAQETGAVVGAPDGFDVYGAIYYFEENRSKEVTDVATEYYEIFDDYTYVFTYNDVRGGWDRDKLNHSIGRFCGLTEGFEDLEYDDLIYTDGVYSFTSIIQEGTDNEYTISAKLQFEGERLVYSRVDAIINGVPQYQAMIFDSYNETSVMLPTEYEDVFYKVPEPTSSATWKSYFDFENVNVKVCLGIEEKDPDLVPVPYPTDFLTIDGDVWLWEGYYQFYKGVVYPSFEVCYDGQNSYARGFLDNSFVTQKDTFLADANFSDYQVNFIEEHLGEDGSYILYSSDRFITVDGNTYEEVEICVRDGRLGYIRYLVTYAEKPNVPARIHYSFNDWSEIEINTAEYTSSEWKALFDLSNVTIYQTCLDIDDGVTRLSGKWRIDGEEWLLIDYYGFGHNSLETHWLPMNYRTYYCDGRELFQDGESLNRPNYTYNYYYYHYGRDAGIDIEWIDFIESVYLHEDSFVIINNGAQSLYTANSLMEGKYTNIEIVVLNGKIETATFTRYDEVYTVEFSNYGNTVVDYEAFANHVCCYTYQINEQYRIAEATCERVACYTGICTECGCMGGGCEDGEPLDECVWGNEWIYSENWGGHFKRCLCAGEWRCEHTILEDCTIENGVCTVCGHHEDKDIE